MANTQLADIKTVLLQFEETYKTQIREDIYNIFEELQNITYGDMEWQAYYIQVLLANKLDRCKGKRDDQVKEYIKII